MAGLVALAVGLAITGAIAVRDGWDSFIDHDAVYFHSVARDLDASEAEAGNSAYRYGRVGLPVLARLISLGSPADLAAGQTLVTPLAFGLVVGIATATATRVSGRWTDGLAVLLVPGLWVGFIDAWADTLLAACVLVSVAATVGRRQWACVVAIALAALTKEIGVLAALPAAMGAAAERRWAWAAARLGAVVPAVLWWTWVRAQAGEWPFLADDPARTRAIAPPLVDVVSALTGGRGSVMAAGYVLALGLVGVAMFLRWPTSALAWSSAIWGVLLVSFGDNVLAYPGDTLRVATPAACVIMLAAAVHRTGAPGSALAVPD